jgi:hypothetical protein
MRWIGQSEGLDFTLHKTIAVRDTKTSKPGSIVFVMDATDDNRITVGGAAYLYIGTFYGWHLLTPQGLSVGSYIEEFVLIENNQAVLQKAPVSGVLITKDIVDLEKNEIFQATMIVEDNIVLLPDEPEHVNDSYNGKYLHCVYSSTTSQIGGQYIDDTKDSFPREGSSNSVKSDGIAKKINESQYYIGNYKVNLDTLSGTRNTLYFDVESQEFSFKDSPDVVSFDPNSFNKNLKNQSITSVDALARYVDQMDVSQTGGSGSVELTAKHVLVTPVKSFDKKGKIYHVTSTGETIILISDVPLPTSIDDLYWKVLSSDNPAVAEFVTEFPSHDDVVPGKLYYHKTLGKLAMSVPFEILGVETKVWLELGGV